MTLQEEAFRIAYRDYLSGVGTAPEEEDFDVASGRADAIRMAVHLDWQHEPTSTEADRAAFRRAYLAYRLQPALKWPSFLEFGLEPGAAWLISDEVNRELELERLEKGKKP